MAFNVNEFLTQLKFGGARPTLFQVYVSLPTVAGTNPGVDATKLAFTVRAASIPESEVGVVQVPYFGRMIKFAGDRTYAPWGVTVINDEDFQVRNALESWHAAINAPEENTRDAEFVADYSQYKRNIEVVQFGQDGEALRRYDLRNAFPMSVGAIGLDWGAQNRLEEFNVTFAYDYWEVALGTSRP